MQELVKKAENEKIVFVEDFKELKNIKNLSNKKLCIIKTDFKNINSIKKFCKTYPALEVWLASEDVSRKNVLSANACGVKNVVPYPIPVKIIQDFFKDKENSEENTNFNNQEYYNLKGLKIMIVDDNQMNIDLLTETLSAMGLEITTFIKPAEASKIVDNKKFDLFLLDIMMPEMSGFDLANIIKTTKLNSDTPIVFISALSDPENKIRGYNAGSCAYIEKPFNVQVVRSQIYNLLKTKKLQEALSDKKETFLAMVTHDLKSPVNAEICALEMLLKNHNEIFDDNKNEIIKDILGAAKYMKNLIDNITQKYKCDYKSIVLNKEPYSLKILVSECIEEAKYFFEDKKQKLILNCNAQDTNLFIDIVEIKRVINNLLINACEYGYKNSNVYIELSENPHEYIFSVKNCGHGIPLSNPDDVFEKFMSVAQNDKKAGTGLGLYICKKIIEAHNGTIHAESKIEDYTKISFTLPK